jgi:hypothetical protein
MNREEKLEIIKATVSQIRINNQGLIKQLENLITIGYKKEEEQAEMIRRFKIQNKKLLEQAELLRQRLKKCNLEKQKLLKG